MSAWRKYGLRVSGGAVEQRFKPQIVGGEKRGMMSQEKRRRDEKT